MLKFTAELSQQFRRASSVSSLKAYHISKSASKTICPNFSVGRHRMQHNHEPRMYDPPRTHGYETHHQFYRSTHKPIQASYNKPRVPDCAPIQYSTCPPQKFHGVQLGRQQHWSTPKRMRCQYNNYLSKQPTTKSVSNFYQGYKNEQPHLPVEPQLSLSELNPNSVKIDQNSKIRKALNNVYAQGNENESTVRKASFKQKANNAAKMRISSINSLENIQKRIQATLGAQNQLRI